LVRRGIEVDVVTAGAEPGRGTAARHEVESATGAPRVFRVRTRRRGLHESGFIGAAEYVPAAVPLVRRLLRQHRFDVVHAFFSLPTGLLLPLARSRAVPTLVSLRGSDVPGYDGSNRALRLAHVVLRPLTRRVWRRADRVVTVCDSLGQLATRTAPGLRYTVIGNGVDLERFRPAAAARPTSDGAITCIAVSRLVARKGLANLLAAWSLLERGRCRLEIVGTGPAEAALRAQASELGLDGDVRFMGPLDRDALAARLRQADLFVLTPLAEAFGNAFAEAMASGLPIVGTAIGGILDIVRHGENGLLVAPGDPRAVAAAVRELASQPLWRQEIGIRNRARAESILSWPHVADQYLDIYRDLAGLPDVAPPVKVPVSDALPSHDVATVRR
jgi:glycosyltransferase involved in cell wall biosynthesis